MANSADPDETTVSSGSKLFAQVLVLVCRAEKGRELKVSHSIAPITKTPLFKYIQNFTTKNWVFI